MARVTAIIVNVFFNIIILSNRVAISMGLEPTTPSVTGKCSNQTELRDQKNYFFFGVAFLAACTFLAVAFLTGIGSDEGNTCGALGCGSVPRSQPNLGYFFSSVLITV